MEGEVIVYVKETSDQPAEGGTDYVLTAEATSFDLLDGAEELMDVSEAAEESEKEETLHSGDGSVLPNETAFAGESDEKTVLKFVHSDEYSTSQLIEMLSTRDDVLFVEPNYIYKMGDTSVEGYETDHYMADDNEVSVYKTEEGADLLATVGDEIILEDNDVDIPAEGAWDGKIPLMRLHILRSFRRYGSMKLTIS